MRIPRHHTIVAYLALFIALGGTSMAAKTALAPKNSVTSASIRNGSVQLVDLAPAARPLTGSALRATVADVIADPATQVNIHVVGEKGDKGDTGASVQGPQGLTGASGSTGPTGLAGSNGQDGRDGVQGPVGPAGNALAYGHIVTSGSDQHTTGSTAVGVTFTHPGGAVYCLNPGSQTFTSLTVSADQQAAGASANPPGSFGCPVGQWRVVTWLANGQDAEAAAVGFYFVAN
jgi:hypothetical protein